MSSTPDPEILSLPAPRGMRTAVRRSAFLVGALALLAAVGPVDGDETPSASFACDDGTTIVASWLDDAAARLERKDERVMVERVVSASGARYQGDEVLFWNKGRNARVEWRGTELECRADVGSGGEATEPDAAATAPTAPTGPDLPLEGSPSEISAWPVPEGRIAQAVERLPGLVEEGMAATGVPGLSVAVVHRDEVVYAAGFGERRVGSGETVDADTVFQIASLSKPIGSTVVAGAVGDGVVAWDDPVVTHLADFALGDPWVTRHVTVADLYAHRSGLPDHAGDLLEDLGFDREQILHRLRFLPLEPFRATYAYTNFGLTAAAEAVAAAAGTTWEELSRRRLYDRIGMNRTSSTRADLVARQNRAVGHQRVEGEWRVLEQRRPDPQSPAGGVSSSARDMARWLRLLLAGGSFDGERVVDAEALLAVQTPRTRTGPKSSARARSQFYGLGMNVSTDLTGRVRLSHSGAFLLGSATAFVAVPAADLGIVVLTNGQPGGLPEAITSAFLDIVELGRVSRDWLGAYEELFAPMVAGPASRLDEVSRPSDPAPAMALDAYVGTYTNNYYGPVRVDLDEEGLVLTAGPDRMAFRLELWDRNTFFLETRGENRSGLSAVDFTAGPNGIADRVSIEKWDDPPGVGTLERVQEPGSL